MKKSMILLAIVCLIISADTLAQRQTRNVTGFTRIDFRLPGKLYLRQGSTDKVEVDADQSVASKIITEIDGSRLVIKTEEKSNWGSDYDDVKVYVTVKNLEGVSASGSGDVVGETKFTTGSLSLKVSGSGSMNVEVEASGEVDADVSGSGRLAVKGKSKSFESHVSGSGRVDMNMSVEGKTDFSISGSGKIEATGKTDDVEISISGSGKVLGANLETNKCEVKISGSGNVEINVKEELDSHISGSGSVSYKGNPSKINNSSSGSGSIRKM